jgi:hypothetical protein
MNPPTMKNTNDVTMYMIPICFASVVRRMRARAEPLTCGRTGHGRLTTGLGTTVVMTSSAELGNHCGTMTDATPLDAFTQHPGVDHHPA